MARYNTHNVYIKHSDLPNIDDRYAALIICEATERVVPHNVGGAQRRDGVWTIELKSTEAKIHLLNNVKGLEIMNHWANIYDDYPIISKRIPTEKITFRDLPFEVRDEDIFDYLLSQPDMKIKTRQIIHAKIRNQNGELTPYYSGDRFVFVQQSFKRVLPSIVDIDHHKCRIIHHSQTLACRRCGFLGHGINDTGSCAAFLDDSDIVTIRSPNNVLCNFYMCPINIYGHEFSSSEHAYQFKFVSHIGRPDLAQEVLNAPNPETAKDIASRIPPHMHKNWHDIKVSVMEEILVAKLRDCPEFKQTLIDSADMRLVEAVKSDRFWSCGLNPKDAATTNPKYFPGKNHLGRLLEHLRAHIDRSAPADQSIPPSKKTAIPTESSLSIPEVASSDVGELQSTPTACGGPPDRQVTTNEHDLIDLDITKNTKNLNTKAVETEQQHSMPQNNLTPKPKPRELRKVVRKERSLSVSRDAMADDVTPKSVHGQSMITTWVKRKLTPGKEADTSNT